MGRQVCQVSTCRELPAGRVNVNYQSVGRDAEKAAPCRELLPSLTSISCLHYPPIKDDHYQPFPSKCPSQHWWLRWSSPGGSQAPVAVKLGTSSPLHRRANHFITKDDHRSGGEVIIASGVTSARAAPAPYERTSCDTLHDGVE